MYSQLANKYFRHLSPFIAQNLKRILVHPRYYRSLYIGRKQLKKYKNVYKHHLLFLAGLPKSGTTWLENMLASYPGFVPILPSRVTKYEMEHKSSIEYDLPEDFFEPLRNGLFVIKMHIYGSRHNVAVLKKNSIRYCLLYRDLRDAAVSHCFYVRATPWHPESQEYRRYDIKGCLKIFCLKRLDEWVNWLKTWRENRDREQSIEVTYEKLLTDTFGTLKKIAQFFELDDSDKTLYSIIEKNKFSQLKKKDSVFFRKGLSGDWRNYFDEEIKKEFKEKAGELLKELGYEKNLDW